MRPAKSLILLTTLIGAGQGLLIALVLIQIAQAFELIEIAIDHKFYAQGALFALLLLLLGLTASFFHLGHPERAWRAASQWRTSWLSREVIVLPMVMGLTAIYWLLHQYDVDFAVIRNSEGLYIRFSLLIGITAVIFSLALYICTGMIYACLKFLQEWASPLTLVNFTLLGIASGFTIATAFSTYYASTLFGILAFHAIIFTALACIARLSSLVRNANIKYKSSPQTAIGVRHNKIRQIAQGAMGGSFNTREFFHGKPESFVTFIKLFFLISVFIIPLALLLISLLAYHPAIVVSAAVIQYVGLLAERWYFFAQANHPQNIYYQAT